MGFENTLNYAICSAILVNRTVSPETKFIPLCSYQYSIVKPEIKFCDPQIAVGWAGGRTSL